MLTSDLLWLSALVALVDLRKGWEQNVSGIIYFTRLQPGVSKVILVGKVDVKIETTSKKIQIFNKILIFFLFSFIRKLNPDLSDQCD